MPLPMILGFAKGLFSGDGGGLKDILDMIPTSAKKDERIQAFQATLLSRASEADIAQNQVNLEQAKHDSMFVAGARPFIMWVCGLGLALAFPIRYIFELVVYWYLVFWVGLHETIAPTFDITQLLVLLGGMLGITTQRMTENLQGKARSSLNLAPKKGLFAWLRGK